MSSVDPELNSPEGKVHFGGHSVHLKDGLLIRLYTMIIKCILRDSERALNSGLLTTHNGRPRVKETQYLG